MKKTKFKQHLGVSGAYILSSCLGVAIGFCGRAWIRGEFLSIAKYWWVALIVLAFSLGVLIGKKTNQKLKDRIRQLEGRLGQVEGLQSPKMDFTQQWPGNDPVSLDSRKNEDSGHKVLHGLKHMHNTDHTRRRVRVTKIFGEGARKAQNSIVGIEERPPEVGRDYRVLTDQGNAFCTSLVITVVPGFIQTQNSFYEIEAIEEE